MICSFPTVTWPNHTTLVTGVPPAKHGVLGNGLFDRKTGDRLPLLPDPLFDKDEIVKAPTIYDAAYKAGLNTAGIIWPATRNAKTLRWTVPDMFGDDSWQKYGTRSWLAELRAEGVPVDNYGEWVKQSSGGVQRDWLYTRMADNLLQKHDPNLLLIHLVEVDHVQHRAGPRSPDAYWSVSYADDRIRDLVESIERSPWKGKTTLIVCSDHGFFPITKEIRPNVLLRRLDLLQTEGGKVTEKIAYCLSEGGGAGVYILDDQRREEIAKQLARELAKVEGIERVFQSDEFDEIGQPTLDQNPYAADLWLAAKKGYSFGGSASGDKMVVSRAPAGTHGFDPRHPDIQGTFVAWGAGIKPGAKLGTISNLSVAPTIARLLGIELPTADGQPLEAILSGK
jgi:predicted AlkP superfamily pyrophosphatase or phosphodiesterase